MAKSHRHHLRTSSLKTRPCSRAIWCCKCTENKLYCHDIFTSVILKLIILYFTRLLSMHLYKLFLNKITYRFNVLNSIKYCPIKHFFSFVHTMKYLQHTVFKPLISQEKYILVINFKSTDYVMTWNSIFLQIDYLYFDSCPYDDPPVLSF